MLSMPSALSAHHAHRRCVAVRIISLWAALADVTNAQAADSSAAMDESVPVKEPLSLASWDVDALTAEKDAEEEVGVAAAPSASAVVEATTVVPAQPSLICAQIDPAILALKVKRAPIAATAAAATIPAFEAAAPAESRRVKLVYDDAGTQIGTQQVAAAPIPSFTELAGAEDEDEEEEFEQAAQEYDDEAGEDLNAGVERMEMPLDAFAAASASAPTEALWHASALTKQSVGTHVTSGFLPAGLVSSSAVRSIKLDREEDIPAFVFAAPASTQINATKVTGFLARGTIDPERLQSKKIE